MHLISRNPPHLKSPSPKSLSSISIQRYPLIDILRLPCAALVVLIHCLEIKEGHPFAHMIVSCFSSQAVPFFFIVSGFFFALKIRSSSDPLADTLHYVKKQLLLYLTWMIIELPSIISTYHQLYPNASFPLFSLLLIRRIFFAGQGVYWYILILAQSCLIAGVCILHQKEKLLYSVSVLGLFLAFIYEAQISAMGLNHLNTLFYVVFSWSNNVIMKGLPFVALGVYLSKQIPRSTFAISKLIAAYLLTGFISITIFFYCYFQHFSSPRFLFLYPIQAALLFLIGIHGHSNASSSVCRTFREASSSIYFLHTIVLYRIVNPIWSVHAPILLKFSLSCLIALLLYSIIKKTHLKPLYFLLSLKS